MAWTTAPPATTSSAPAHPIQPLHRINVERAQIAIVVESLVAIVHDGTRIVRGQLKVVPVLSLNGGQAIFRAILPILLVRKSDCVTEFVDCDSLDAILLSGQTLQRPPVPERKI